MRNDLSHKFVRTYAHALLYSRAYEKNISLCEKKSRKWPVQFEKNKSLSTPLHPIDADLL